MTLGVGELITVEQGAVELPKAHETIVVGGKSGWISAFREGGAAGVERGCAVGVARDVGQVRVALTQEVDAAARRTFLPIDVTLGENDVPTVVDEMRAGLGDGEIEEHLIDFAVAIAAYTHNVVGHGVESRRYAGGIETGGEAVARTVVEQIAEQEEHVAAHLLIMRQNGIERSDRAVYVGNNKVFHKLLWGKTIENIADMRARKYEKKASRAHLRENSTRNAVSAPYLRDVDTAFQSTTEEAPTAVAVAHFNLRSTAPKLHPLAANSPSVRAQLGSGCSRDETARRAHPTCDGAKP